MITRADVDEFLDGRAERVAELEDAIAAAMNELGIPQDDYPAPVANAYEVLRVVLGFAFHKPLHHTPQIPRPTMPPLPER